VTQHRSDCWRLDFHAPDGMPTTVWRQPLASRWQPHRKTGSRKGRKGCYGDGFRARFPSHRRHKRKRKLRANWLEPLGTRF
jgi:hypothetical protein